MRAIRPEITGELPEHVESDGVVSIEAENFTRQLFRLGAEWRVLPDLGRTGGRVAVFPTTTGAISLWGARGDRTSCGPPRFRLPTRS